MNVIYFVDLHDVLESSKTCEEEKHFQQAAYSLYGKCMSIVCWNCQTIRSNFKPAMVKVK